jgi:hypothetical protein
MKKKIRWIYRVANSTPIVLLLSRLNSFRVNLESKLLFPTPESPISTTKNRPETKQIFYIDIFTFK